MYKFIWGSKWEKIGRSQLCCDVKEEGGKMIDIKQYVLSLRFNFIFKLFDNNYQSSWKSLKSRCIDENVFFCIFRSNVKLNSMLVGRVAFLRFTLTTLTLGCTPRVNLTLLITFLKIFFHMNEFTALGSLTSSINSFHTYSKCACSMIVLEI